MSTVSSSVTSLSWIPSEAMSGFYKLGMILKIGHYDPPPPDRLASGDLTRMRDEGLFRFANELRAEIDLDDDGRIVDARYLGGLHLGTTTVKVAGLRKSFANVPFPVVRRDPEFGDGFVRFVQTVGGRTSFPFPRKVNRPPWVQFLAPTVWTTLSLTVHADGRSEHEVLGASPFPRHWVYDAEGRLVQKSGRADYPEWMADSFGDHSPWAGHDVPTLMAEAETVLERQLSTLIMQGGQRPTVRRIGQDEFLTRQGEPGEELYLVLDGMFRVEVDGEAVADVGPGAIVGERAILEAGARTSSLRALTPGRVAVATPDQLDREALRELSEGHRREDDVAEPGAAPAPSTR